MIYEVIAMLFLTLSSLFIYIYLVIALGNQRRLNKVRKITESKQFINSFTGDKSNNREDSDYRKYEEGDLLSLVAISDYTTDHEIRNNIKKGIEILMKRKKG